jgi:hypothetical protein
MKKLIACLLCVCLTSCVVEYTPGGYIATNGYSRSHFYTSSLSHSRNCYGYRGSAIITPVSHGFDPDPQYVRGYVFRGGDEMLYAAEH